MLTLKNFEKEVNATILQRGRSYFKQEAVIDLEQTGDNTWQAEVEGTDMYQVEITLKNNDEITEQFCDCPYDGEVCKHAVAVFYALREAVKAIKPGKAGSGKKQNTLETLLQQITLPEFQEFIRQYAASHRDFKDEFEVYFAEKDERIDVGKKYEELVKKLIRKHSDHGFVDYRATYGLSKEMDKILDNARALIRKQHYTDGFRIGTVVLKALANVQEQSDDSAGNIGSTLDETVTLISDIATEPAAARELKNQIMDFLNTELQDRVYFEFGDCGYDMYKIFGKLALQLDRTEEYLAITDKKLSRMRGPYSGYEKEFYLQRKMETLQALGKTKEAENLVWENLDVVAVRKAEVNKALAKKDYNAAKKLILEGIKVAEAQGHPGTVSEWKKQILKIAEEEKDINKVRELTRHFAFDRGFDKEYYRQWKATYKPEEWKTVINAYLNRRTSEIKQDWERQKNYAWRPKQPPYLLVLGPVFKEERNYDRLLELVEQSKNLDTVLQYHNVLASHNPEKLVEIYLPLLETAGKQADGRNAYASLAEVMKKIVKDIPAGKAAIKALAEKLKALHVRRPAMLEELNKVLKLTN